MKALPDIPLWMKRLGIVLGLAALIPPVLVARARVSTSESPRIHLIPDMDNQGKFKAQARNDLFVDRRAMRPPVAGTVVRGGLESDSHLHRGLVDGKWARKLPMPVTRALLERGRERFDIYCAVCHGRSGYGNGPVAVRAEQLQLQGKATWVPPTSYHEGDPPTRAVGHLFNTITNGIRNMPAYGDQIVPVDRWAIVAYVKALMRSQAAKLEDVAEPAVRDELLRKKQ